MATEPGAAATGGPGSRIWPSYQRATSLTAMLGGMARRPNASADPAPARAVRTLRASASGGCGRRPEPATPGRPDRRPASSRGDRRASLRRPSVVVLGDLMLDAVLKPSHPMVRGTDVPGLVMLRQGGSAANAARWLGRLGVRVQLICAVGRDGVGRALVDTLQRDGVVVRAARVRRLPTGRIGVVVSPGSETVGSAERSFVADRGAADALTRADVRSAWFRGVDVLHLPAYSLLGEPLGSAGRWAAQLARMNGAAVSVDLASSGPLLAGGQTAAQALLRSVAPDVLFATASEAEALLGGWALEGLLAFAPVVVIKRGAQGASILARGEGSTPIRSDIATTGRVGRRHDRCRRCVRRRLPAAWLEGRATGQPATDSLRRATLAGHRVAARHLAARPSSWTSARARAGAAARLRAPHHRVRSADDRRRHPRPPRARPRGGRRARSRAAVVALESTLISHGLPYPQNVEVARASEAAVRASGAVPATVAVRDGRFLVGLADADLEALATAPAGSVRKVARPSLASALAAGGWAATTVGATMIAAHAAGIRVFATGGIGGVHRGAIGGPAATMDISSDLEELARTPMAVVCAGPKAILDVALTLEYLETHGVPVVAVGQADLPGFYSRSSGIAAPAWAPDEAATAEIVGPTSAWGWARPSSSAPRSRPPTPCRRRTPGPPSSAPSPRRRRPRRRAGADAVAARPHRRAHERRIGPRQHVPHRPRRRGGRPPGGRPGRRLTPAARPIGIARGRRARDRLQDICQSPDLSLSR